MRYSSNPFSTRYTRPGAIPFRFDHGCNGWSAGNEPVAAASADRELADDLDRDDRQLEQIVAKVMTTHRISQIVGPHGSGKSTLIAGLTRQLIARGFYVKQFELHDQQRRLPAATAAVRSMDQQTFAVVDGYEQLPWYRRSRFERLCRRKGAGLVVTTHRDLGLPTLWETTGSLTLLRQLVRHLTTNCPDQLCVSEATVLAAYCKHGSNMREALFQLYDDFEMGTSRLEANLPSRCDR